MRVGWHENDGLVTITNAYDGEQTCTGENKHMSEIKMRTSENKCVLAVPKTNVYECGRMYKWTDANDTGENKCVWARVRPR
jgi:hypothetical protein